MNDKPWPWEPMPKETTPKRLTVAEVITILQTMPQDALVNSDGCDCIGECVAVDYDQSDNTVLMSRS